MLKVRNLKTGYGKKQILNDVSLEVGKGEIVAIIGHNGAGKSTFLKSIFGLLPVWKGEIEFDGKQIQNRKSIENVKNGLSLVMQGNRVFTELTVLENLDVSGYLLNGKSEIQSRLNHVFELFPILADRRKQNAGTLSGGEQQMLALSNALILQPKILLLDEPSLGLSPKFVQLALKTIQEMNQKLNVSILIVEQKVREVLRIAQRVYVFRLGEVASESKPEFLLEGQRLREVFLA